MNSRTLLKPSKSERVQIQSFKHINCYPLISTAQDVPVSELVLPAIFERTTLNPLSSTHLLYLEKQEKFLRRSRSTVVFEISVLQSRNLLHHWYGRVNYVLHAMPRTTFVRVSKTFPATIACDGRTTLCTVRISIQNHLEGYKGTLVLGVNIFSWF